MIEEELIQDSPESHDYLAPALVPVEGHFALVTTTFTNIVGPPARLEVRVLRNNQLHWIAEWDLPRRWQTVVGYELRTTTNGRIKICTWTREEGSEDVAQCSTGSVEEVPEMLQDLMPWPLKDRVKEIVADGEG